MRSSQKFGVKVTLTWVPKWKPPERGLEGEVGARLQSGIKLGWDAGLRAADGRELWRMWGPSSGQLTGRRLAKEERDAVCDLTPCLCALGSVRLGEGPHRTPSSLCSDLCHMGGHSQNTDPALTGKQGRTQGHCINLIVFAEHLLCQ